MFSILLVISWLSTEKVFTAFIGALIALGLNRVLIYYDRLKKEEDIRKLIVSDLKKQKISLKLLKHDIEVFLPNFKFGYSKEMITLVVNHNVNTDTIKSQTKMDIFKSFNDIDFHLIMSIYKNLKLCEEVNLFNYNQKMFNEINGIIKLTDGVDKEERMKMAITLYENERGRLMSINKGIDATNRMIDAVIKNVETKYDVIY